MYFYRDLDQIRITFPKTLSYTMNKIYKSEHFFFLKDPSMTYSYFSRIISTLFWSLKKLFNLPNDLLEKIIFFFFFYKQVFFVKKLYFSKAV